MAIVKVAELELWDKNPREIDDTKFEALCKYIEKWGLLTPLLVDGRDKTTILGGNMRLKALRKLGIEEVEIKYIDIKSDSEAVEIALLDNNQFGAYIESELIELVLDYPELELSDFEVDLNPISFADLIPAKEGENESGEDDYEQPPEPKYKVELGDVFELGNHRLMCGDSTKIEAVEKLMGGVKADLWITDPPYSVNYSSKNKFLNNLDKGKRIQKDIINDRDLETAIEVWRLSFKNAAVHLKGISSYYCFMPQGGDQMMMMMMMANEADMQVKHELIWVKNNHVLGRSDYNYKHEPIIYGWKKNGTHKFYGDFSTSILEFAKPVSSKLHPTMKPVELLMLLIKNNSLENMIVIDFFGGSGSTLIACEQTNRKCYMMEISPYYISVILERYEQFTGKEITKLI